MPIIVGSRSGSLSLSLSGSQSARYRWSTVLIAGRGFLNAGPTPGASPGTRFDPDSDPDCDTPRRLHLVGECRPDDHNPPTFGGINNFATNRIEGADDQGQPIIVGSTGGAKPRRAQRARREALRDLFSFRGRPPCWQLPATDLHPQAPNGSAPLLRLPGRTNLGASPPATPCHQATPSCPSCSSWFYPPFLASRVLLATTCRLEFTREPRKPGRRRIESPPSSRVGHRSAMHRREEIVIRL